MKSLLFLSMVTLIISCNNDSGIGGNNRGGWTSQQRNKFINDCIRQAENNPQAKSFCNCLQQKAEQKYPNASDADRGTEEEGRQMGRECLQGGNVNNNDFDNNNTNYDDNLQDNQGGWTERDKRKIYNDCMSQVDNTPEAQAYCNCFAQKVARKYRTLAAANRGTKEEGEALGRECLGQDGGNENDDY